MAQRAAAAASLLSYVSGTVAPGGGGWGVQGSSQQQVIVGPLTPRGWGHHVLQAINAGGNTTRKFTIIKDTAYRPAGSRALLALAIAASA